MPAWVTLRSLVLAGAAVLAVAMMSALFIWRGDILEALLDPRVPYQTYTPPPAPDYAKASAWALEAGAAEHAPAPPVDVFFVHPTIYDGGRDWNGPIDQKQASATLFRVMLPNYAGPFARLGRVFAPRYRSASLYSMLTLREDARDARAFAFGDVQRAFRAYLAGANRGRPFILVGVEQGGAMVARLLTDDLARQPGLRARLVAAYLIDTAAPRDAFNTASPVPACAAPNQKGCLVAWKQAWSDGRDVENRILARSMVWSGAGALEALGARQAVCVNPMLGSDSTALAPNRLNLGAANATGLEWGVRPAFLPREVSARCEGGLLRVSHPKAASLRPSGSWAERQKPPDYNLFYENLEVDAKRRTAAWLGRSNFPAPAPPIDRVVEVRPSPIRRAH